MKAEKEQGSERKNKEIKNVPVKIMKEQGWNIRYLRDPERPEFGAVTILYKPGLKYLCGDTDIPFSHFEVKFSFCNSKDIFRRAEGRSKAFKVKGYKSVERSVTGEILGWHWMILNMDRETLEALNAPCKGVMLAMYTLLNEWAKRNANCLLPQWLKDIVAGKGKKDLADELRKTKKSLVAAERTVELLSEIEKQKIVDFGEVMLERSWLRERYEQHMSLLEQIRKYASAVPKERSNLDPIRALDKIYELVSSVTQTSSLTHPPQSWDTGKGGVLPPVSSGDKEAGK